LVAATFIGLPRPQWQPHSVHTGIHAGYAGAGHDWSAPQGSDKTIKTDKKGNVEGTPKN